MSAAESYEVRSCASRPTTIVTLRFRVQVLGLGFRVFVTMPGSYFIVTLQRRWWLKG